jgi:polyphosphate kinase
MTLSPSQFGPDRFSNRELSRLEFGARLLDLAADRSQPILDRCKFAAIFAEMLDEFFQVRVVSLEDKIAAGIESPSLDGMRPKDQLRAIRDRVSQLSERLDRIFLDELVPALADHSIHLVAYDSLSHGQKSWMRAYFDELIYPVLTPLSVDPGHPFPMISNLSLNLAATVHDPDTGDERQARVKVPSTLPRFVAVDGSSTFVRLEEVIAAHVDSLFPGMQVGRTDIFRVTRNADLSVEEDEADDLLVALEVELRRRRFGRALRVEIESTMDPDFLSLLLGQLDLEPSRVYATSAPLGLGDLWQLFGLDRPDLKATGWSPLTPPRLSQADGIADIFGVIRDGDVLLHHPYESFTDSVEMFIRQAAADPAVVGIKQTLYRTSGDSPIVKSLIAAAEAGKQVAALVELKARFDEAANIEWAKALEESGVHVVYGVMGFKTHSKTALVLRREGDQIRRYVHIGTGNYNSKTARIYEDFGLLTCNEDITRDVADLFNFLTGFSKHAAYSQILVSPVSVRQGILERIARQTERGVDGLIEMKVNGLTDPTIIDALYRASQAGTRVRLVVRTLCCVRPGVEGLSENISVRSIVGEFLEHSRIYSFGQPGDTDYEVLIGSADLMERNLDRRIEVLVPVRDPALRQQVAETLTLCLRDDTSAWALGSDRRWRKVEAVDGVSVQATLRERALREAGAAIP